MSPEGAVRRRWEATLFVSGRNNELLKRVSKCRGEIEICLGV